MSTLDFNQYKEWQRQSWDSVSKGWQKWCKAIENGAQNIGNRLIQLAHIKPGSALMPPYHLWSQTNVSATKFVNLLFI